MASGMLQVFEGLEFIFIELPKFKSKQIRDKKLNVLWLRFLSEISDGQEDIPDDFKNEPSILEASEYAKESAYTKTELEAYDRYWDSISSEKTLITEAFDEGKQIGLEKGKIEGEQIGLEKGKIEELNKGIIKALKRGKLSIEEIAEDFEVSIEYVLEIKKTMD